MIYVDLQIVPVPTYLSYKVWHKYSKQTCSNFLSNNFKTLNTNILRCAKKKKFILVGGVLKK